MAAHPSASRTARFTPNHRSTEGLLPCLALMSDQVPSLMPQLPLRTGICTFFPAASPSSRSPSTGILDATTCVETLERWSRDLNDPQIAIACAPSGLVVIDVDDPVAWQRWLADQALSEPATTEVITPSGGRHLYFRSRPGAVYPGQVCPFVDIKHKGYVLAPPARAWSQRQGVEGNYEWAPSRRDDDRGPSVARTPGGWPGQQEPCADRSEPAGDTARRVAGAALAHRSGRRRLSSVGPCADVSSRRHRRQPRRPQPGN